MILGIFKRCFRCGAGRIGSVGWMDDLVAYQRDTIREVAQMASASEARLELIEQRLKNLSDSVSRLMLERPEGNVFEPGGAISFEPSAPFVDPIVEPDGGQIILATPWLKYDATPAGWRSGMQRGVVHQWYACGDPLLSRGATKNDQVRIAISEVPPPMKTNYWASLFHNGLCPGLTELGERLGWNGSTDVFWWFEKR